MPSLINRIPAGLADVLGIKATGRSPYVLLDEVRAVMDISDFYSLSLEPRFFFVQANVTASVATIAYTCPAYQCALVTEFGAYGVCDIGEFYKGSIGLRCNGKNDAGATSSYDIPLTPSNGGGSASVATTVGAAAIQRPVLLRPGDSLIVWSEEVVTAGAVLLVTRGRYIALPV